MLDQDPSITDPEQQAEIDRWSNKDWELPEVTDSDISQSPIIAIGGCGRSGTTLMRVMLDTHSQIAAGPESHLFLPTAIDIESLAEKFDLPVEDLRRAHEGASSRTAFIEAFQAMYTQRTGKTYWADKTARNIHRIGHIFEHFPEARFIHVVRDGRDVVTSLRTHRKRKKVDGEIRETGYRMPFEDCTDRWNLAIEDAKPFQGDPRYLEVRYENLIHETRAALMQVCGFVGVRYEEAMMEFHTVDTPSRDAKRFFIQNIEATQPKSYASAGRWRRDLSPEQLKFILPRIAENLRYMGYPLGIQVPMIDANTVQQIIEQHPGLVKEALLEALSIHHDKDGLVQPPKTYLQRSPKAHTADRIIAMPVYAEGKGDAIAGIKWIGSHPDNHQQGLQRANAVIILNDPKTNAPMAILDGSIISSLRTFGMSQVAIERFCPKPKTVAVIGMGKLGRMHASQLKSLFPTIERIQCFSERADFSDLQSGTVTACASYQEALQNADVVITTTAANTPYIHEADLGEETKLIVNLSLMDFDLDVYARSAQIIVDDWGQCERAKKVFKQGVDQGEITRENVIEISDALFGDAKDHKFTGRVIVNPLGMGVEDMVLAKKVLEKTRGQRLPEFNIE